MNSFDVLTCGSATVDIFAHTDNEIRTLKLQGTEKECMVYPVGAKMVIGSLQQHIGGGGTNTAAAFSKLKLHTGFVGCLGRDEHAASVLHELQKDHISFLGHQTDNASTGYSIILDSVAHDRTILTFKGANNNLSFQKLPLQRVHTKGLYCSSMLGSSFTSQTKLCMWAKKQNALVAYNPSQYQLTDRKKELLTLLKKLDILIFNKEEAQLLLKTKNVGHDLIRQYVQLLPTTVITDGSQSVFVCHHGNFYEVFPKKVKVVETTGAGDAFSSGFFGALVLGKKIETALLYGLANSQSVVQSYGAKNGLLSGNEIEKYIKKHKLTGCVKSHGSTL